MKATDLTTAHVYQLRDHEGRQGDLDALDKSVFLRAHVRDLAERLGATAASASIGTLKACTSCPNKLLTLDLQLSPSSPPAGRFATTLTSRSTVA